MTAATAQENYYKTDCEIPISPDTILRCQNWGNLIAIEFKSDPSCSSLYPEGERKQNECDAIALSDATSQDWDKIDSTIMVVFLETFTDEQIRGFYANKYKKRALFSLYPFYDVDGNVVKVDMVFDNTPNYTSVHPAIYANFLRAFREKFKMTVKNKKYPYYSTAYGFRVPDLSIIPKSTKK